MQQTAAIVHHGVFGFLGGYNPVSYLESIDKVSEIDWNINKRVDDHKDLFLKSEDEPACISIVDVTYVPLQSVFDAVARLRKEGAKICVASLTQILQLQIRRNIVQCMGVRLYAGEIMNLRGQFSGQILGYYIESGGDFMRLSCNWWYRGSVEKGESRHMIGRSMTHTGLEQQSIVVLISEPGQPMIDSLAYEIE
ncbi:MAG: hypothetical protein WC761_04425 [Candidatus Paceibacterota bacterium]|jgi:hypothetical protein